MKTESIVPDQESGAQVDVEHRVDRLGGRQARRLFVVATNRLLNVNDWDRLCGHLSAVFRLTDKLGNEVTRSARPGDYFKISIPGPGTGEGDGFDWVRVEAIEDQRDPAGPLESIAVRVRPAPNPLNDGKDIAHFFDEAATSTFVVQRAHNEVVAAVRGRNEMANTDTGKALDNARNAIVATGAKAGVSAIQWKSLVKGLLATGSDISSVL